MAGTENDIHELKDDMIGRLGLTRRQRRTIDGLTDALRIAGGTTIFRRGSRYRHIYICTSGKVSTDESGAAPIDTPFVAWRNLSAGLTWHQGLIALTDVDVLVADVRYVALVQSHLPGWLDADATVAPQLTTAPPPAAPHLRRPLLGLDRRFS